MTDLTGKQTQQRTPEQTHAQAENEDDSVVEPAPASARQPIRLRCEYQQDPLGIDVLQPRLSWWSGDDRPAELQTAYQVLCASHPEILRMDEGDLWDSGQVGAGKRFNWPTKANR